MRRIGLAIVVTFTLLVAPLAGEAQPVEKVYRIGVLTTGDPRFCRRRW
jgi:hypothetical protein